jgi:uncharacterized protein (DUF58 family)
MSVRGFLEEQFRLWLDRRIPRETEVALTQRRIFIFPTMQALYLLLVVILLLLTGINYQNNLAYLLAFFLVSIFNTTILLTYLNLAGLRLRAGRHTPVFAGEHTEVEIELARLPQKAHHQLQLSWPDNTAQIVSLVRPDRITVRLPCKTVRRGLFHPGRFVVESFYPLGLLRCWSWVDLDTSIVVYPKPLRMGELPATAVAGSAGRESPLIGKEDFYGFREYAPGDSLRHVDWRSLARGQPLQSKVYAAQQDEKHWVDWYELSAFGTEERLSRMCGWVLQLEESGKSFGLRLPGVEIAPDLGELHCKRVLTELALHGKSREGA